MLLHAITQEMVGGPFLLNSFQNNQAFVKGVYLSGKSLSPEV